MCRMHKAMIKTVDFFYTNIFLFYHTNYTKLDYNINADGEIQKLIFMVV